MLTSAIIAAHAAKYPLMQPTDAVKLAYQAAFGGGHLIKDEEACRRYLEAEYASVAQNASAPLCEAISAPRGECPGIVRVNLCALDAHGVTPDALCRAFIESAGITSRQTDAADVFRGSLTLLRQAADDGLFCFPRAALDAYLDEYLAVPGLPPVSHSPEYRDAYSPHYRVVCSNLPHITY